MRWEVRINCPNSQETVTIQKNVTRSLKTLTLQRVHTNSNLDKYKTAFQNT